MSERVGEDVGRVHALWRELTQELAGILDAHTVCATAAYAIARHTNVKTVVGLTGPSDAYFDVWICEPDGHIEQKRWGGERASFRPLLESPRPLRLAKFDLPAGQLLNSELWQLARQSVLGISLPYPVARSATATTGALCLLDPDENSPIQEQNFGELATLISSFLERADLSRRSIQQEIEFAVVHDISYSLTASLDLDDIFRQLSNHIRRTLNVEHLSIALKEAHTGDLVFVNVLMGPLFRDRPEVRIKAGQGIAGWVAERARPLIVNDVYQDQRFFSRVDSSSGFRTESILAVPLQVEQRVIGVIEAINKQTGNFNDNDLRLLEAISAPLAVAIENARLHTDVVAEKRRIETFFASMSEGLLIVTKERIVTMANDAFLTLMRRGEAEVLGQSVDTLFETRNGNLSEFVDEVFAAGDEYPQFATDIRAGNSYVPLLVGGAAIPHEEEKPQEAILTFSDLTQIREFERMRDDFFANIIHELRTPLATILMYARLLRQGRAGDDPAKADRFLGVIERESDRLQTMVRQMLQLAKLETSDFQRSTRAMNLNNVFKEFLPAMADRATQKGLIFKQHVEPDLPSVEADADSLYLIFKNLVENAIKFTLDGAVTFDARRVDGHIRVTVADDGIGMPEESLPLLFQRFYRSQTAVERGIAGTGLGLYMVKETVEALNGNIAVTSQIDEGTTFTVELPMVDE